MKKLYRVVMSRGEDFVFEEGLVKKIMSLDTQILEVPMENRTIWINKAHIVCIFLDREETSREKRKDYQPDLPLDNQIISPEKIRELKEKAKLLAEKKAIKKEEDINPDDLPF